MMFCAGGRLPTALTDDESARRWLIAAINTSEALAWAADLPTVLQPLPEAASCDSDDAELGLQVRLSHISAVSREIDKFSANHETNIRSSELAAPPGCRAGLWNAVVDFMDNIHHARRFVDKYKKHLLQTHRQR
jgi:hypothetical protein